MCCPTTPWPSGRTSPFQVYDAADAVESLVSNGLERTQQRFNS
jgi:hypothetical protein